MGSAGARAVLLQAERAHAGEVACLDACGARLVTGGGRALRLWAWRRGRGWAPAGEARAAHRLGVTGARWAPGGALLASCGVDGALRVWSARLAARRLLAAGGAAAARALCWAGGRLLAGHDDGSVAVWAVREAALLARFSPLEGAVHALCTPARDALLLVACTHGVLKVYDLDEVIAGGAEQGAGPAPLLAESGAHDLGALCAAAAGRRAATAGHDATIRLWELEGSGRGRRLVAAGRLEGHGAAVAALRWARGRLASAALDRTARVWDPAARACLLVLHAHPRYLTSLAIAPDLAYLITGSNDKTFRMWSLGGLDLDQELEPPCDGSAHFGLGDLQGISQLDDEDLLQVDAREEGAGGAERAGGARRVWGARAHAGAVNCVSARGDLLATASSDGLVKVFRCAGGALTELHALEAHQYPALALAWGARALLLSGGLDGQAVLWDAETGVRLRTLVPPAGAGAAGDAGGGGVRGAALSAHRPPLLLLATDDGLAPVWSLADDDPLPMHVYGAGEDTGAAWCCSWAAGGRAAALGAAGGALRLVAPPPPLARAQPLALVADAHDLGVTSCEWAPSAEAAGGEGRAEASTRLVLATAGGDSLIKLWLVDIDEDVEAGSARIQLVRRLSAHGVSAARAAWGAGRAAPLLASAGDRWARAWAGAAAVAGAEGVRGAAGGAGGRCVAAAPAPDADVALAAALIAPDDDANVYLAIGTLQGYVAVWQLEPDAEGAVGVEEEEEEGEAEAALGARWWRRAGVRQWLREYVTRVPGRALEPGAEAALLAAAQDARLTGARLLDDPLPDLLRVCGFESASSDEQEGLSLESSDEEEREPARARLRRELRWLRRAPPSPAREDGAPHALRCALSHRLLAAPARAPDGCTYERAVVHDWFLGADGAVSPVSGRRLRSARLQPNLGVRRALRRYLRAPPSPPPAPSTPPAPSSPPPEHPPPEASDDAVDTADLMLFED